MTKLISFEGIDGVGKTTVINTLKEQLEHLTKNMRDKSLEVESSLEEKVDKLLSESDDKSEDLIDLLEKKLEALKKMAKK